MYKLSFEKRVWVVKQALRGMPHENRPHMSLLYKTPSQVWNELKRK